MLLCRVLLLLAFAAAATITADDDDATAAHAALPMQPTVSEGVVKRTGQDEAPSKFWFTSWELTSHQIRFSIASASRRIVPLRLLNSVISSLYTPYTTYCCSYLLLGPLFSCLLALYRRSFGVTTIFIRDPFKLANGKAGEGDLKGSLMIELHPQFILDDPDRLTTDATFLRVSLPFTFSYLLFRSSCCISVFFFLSFFFSQMIPHD